MSAPTSPVVLPDAGSLLIKAGAAPQNTFRLSYCERQGNHVVYVGRLLGVAENHHSRTGDLMTMASYDWGRDFVVVTPECCCTDTGDGPYCGDPECDIFYCLACGDEFEEPCARHQGVNHD